VTPARNAREGARLALTPTSLKLVAVVVGQAPTNHFAEKLVGDGALRESRNQLSHFDDDSLRSDACAGAEIDERTDRGTELGAVDLRRSRPVSQTLSEGIAEDIGVVTIGNQPRSSRGKSRGAGARSGPEDAIVDR
jgi:hypothetical protein